MIDNLQFTTMKRSFAIDKLNEGFFPLFPVLIFFIVISSCVSNESEKTSDSRKRPNILFAFADDQSWLHTSAFGDKIVKTPAFDKVANEGVLFTHSFSACPSCTPSRSAVISGQDIWRIQEAGVLFGSIPKDLKIYPHMLEDAGYHVIFKMKLIYLK